MNRIYKNLEDLLKQKIKLYDSFLKLLQEEWICLSQYSYESLNVVIAKKENKVMQMQALENSRSSLMGKIAENLKVKTSDLTLKKLIQLKDNPYKNNFDKCRKKLILQIKQINEESEKVKNMIDHSALSLKKSLAYIHSADEKAVSPYTATGQMMEGRVEGRMVSIDI